MLPEPIEDTDTIPTGLTYDPVTGVLTQTLTDKDGTTLPPITTTITASGDTNTIPTGHSFDPVTGVFTTTLTDVDGAALPSITTTLPLDTNTIQTGATYDEATGILTQTFTDKDGVALPDITTSIPQLDICATPTRAPDVATMEIIYCDASGLGKMSYRDFLNIDSDGDGLPDVCEICLKTDPDLPDTDGGGVNDGDEVTAGLDPLDSDDDICTSANNVVFTDVGSTTYFMSDNAGTGDPITDVGGNIIGYEWTKCPDTVVYTDVSGATTLNLRTS